MPIDVLSSIKRAASSDAVNKLLKNIANTSVAKSTPSKNLQSVTLEELRKDIVVKSSSDTVQIIKENFPEEKNGYLVLLVFLMERNRKLKNLSWKTDVNGGAQWGHWLRQTVLNKTRGDVLMSGNEGSPLLILDRTGQGRVAQIASDHISLWARGYDGGGPHSELLRRTVHWLMKEPELDENALDINVSGKNIFLRAANYKEINNNILMIGPDGQTETLTLEQMPDGTLGNTIEADQLGIYSFENANAQVRYAVVGVLNPPELRGVKTTETPMRDVTNESGGGIIWLSETTTPAIKRLSKTNNYAGKQWIGLKKNNAYRVKNVNARPMMPPWLSVMLLLGLVILTWVREGRSA